MIDFKITEEKRNDLLGRLEIKAIVSKKEGITPSRAELLKLVAEKMKKQEDHIEIDGIFQKFGKQEAILKVKVWDNAPVKKETKTAQPAEKKE